MVDQFTLISGAPVKMDGYKIYPPRLGDIREIGYSEYQMLISSLLMSKDELFKIMGIEPPEDAISLDALQITTIIPGFRVTLLRALNFFIHEEVLYDEELGYHLESGKWIEMKELWEIRGIILQLCKVESNEEEAPKEFLNEKARARYEKIQKLKSKFKKAGKTERDANFDLPNLIAAVSAVSSTYNLLNIWDLTIYQFYDQFERLNSKIQLGVFGQRWAAWGKEEFDFSLWYKAASK